MQDSMKRVLILGSSGFVGRHLLSTFSVVRGVEVVHVPSRRDLNMCDASAVQDFFRSQEGFAFVFLCTGSGGRRGIPETEKTMEENLAMMENVMSCQLAFDILVCFGSGAEFDRSKPIDCVLELAPEPPPLGQWYGRAKYFIRKKYGSHPKVVNWRIISCYGPDELSQRFIASCLRAKDEGRPVIIDKDREFDFVHIDHLCDAAARLVNGDAKLKKNMNLCYLEKRRLSEVATRLGALPEVEEDSNLHYTGKADDYFASLYSWKF